MPSACRVVCPEGEEQPCGTFFVRSDEQHMRRALALAVRGRGRTSPNPMVGCVIVRDGAVIGEGYHECAGEPHAEVNAVRAAAGDIIGATVCVTLEPCAHHGRTPPCTDLLIEHKPSRVVVAMADPDPQVSGRGIGQLREAGIAVDVGLLEPEARRLNEAYIKHRSTGMPFVIAKCGMSLDGKIATRTGDSRWVTGDEARRMVHGLRDEVDAILVGARTVMVDDPRLTTRLDDGPGKDPIRVILDGDGALTEDRRVFHVDSAAPTWVALPEGESCPSADDVLSLPPNDRGLDLCVLMRELGARGVVSVMIEGGGATHASAFEAGIVDKVMFFIAPKIIGGCDAVPVVAGEGVARLADAVPLDEMTARPVGDDILIEAYVGGRQANRTD